MSDKVYRYAIYARFLNCGKLSSKEYKYYLSEDQIDDMCESSYWMMLSDNNDFCKYPVWDLETMQYSDRGKTSTYSNSVIFTRLVRATKEEYEKDQRPYIVSCQPSSIISYTIANTNNLPHGITNVQGYFDGVRIDKTFDFWDLLFVNDIERSNEDMTTNQATTTCNCANESLVWNGTSFKTEYTSIWNDDSITTVDTPDSSKVISGIKTSPCLVSDDCNINGCIQIDANDLYNTTDLNELKEAIEELKNGKEEKTMLNTSTIMKDFNFGKAMGVKMSMYGPAFQSMDNKGNSEWIALESKTGDWVDASMLLLNVDIPFYQMPVSKDKIAVNDFIKHNGSWVRIIDFDETTLYPIVEDVYKKEVKTIIPTKSPFGFDFYTKLVNIMGDINFNGSKDQPFGNMLPLMLMNSGKMDDMLPLMFMMNGGNMDMSNPMMMMLCGDGKMKDMLPFMMMMNMNKEKK